MKENILVGYHATTTDNANLIMTNGFIESKPQKGHWLGKGIYFFEDLYYAVEWGIIGVIKSEIKEYNELMEKCSILTSDIDTNEYNVLDLSSPQGYAIFEKLLNIIKKSYPKKEYEYIEEQGHAYIIKILEKIELITGEEYISGFDVICAVYPKKIDKKQRKLVGNFLSCVQKQICVKNPNAIKKIERIEYSEIIEELFKLVIKNRGGKND